jgi:PAS domain S-box-containing protein
MNEDETPQSEQYDRGFVERALESAGFGVFEYDALNGSQRFSSRARQIWGLAPDEQPTAERIRSMIHPDDRGLELLLAEALQPTGPGEFSVEHRIVRSGGEIRWVRTRGRTIFRGEGESRRAVRSVGTMVDITEHRSAENLLQKNAETFYHLIKNNPFGVYVIDSGFRLCEVSKGAQKVFANVKPLLGRDFADVLRIIWAEPFASETITRFRHTLATGEAFSAPSTVEQRADSGEVEAYDWRIERIAMPDGKPGVVCYFYDLSERQRWAAEVHDREQRLRQVIDSMFAFVGVLDPAGTLIEANRAPLEAAGLLRDDVIGRAFWDCDWWNYDSAVSDRLRAAFERARSGELVRYDETIRVANDRKIVIDFMMQPVFEDGQLRFVIPSAVDVTSRLQAERKLLEADRRKDEFLAMLSHELRNPLAPIRNAAQILASPRLSDESLVWARQVIQRQVAHMALLLDDLLDVARITQGKLVLKKEVAPLASIVESAVEAVRPLIDSRGHTLSIDLPHSAPSVLADPTRLSQVVTNLLTNAAKYTNAGGLIKLTASTDTEHLQIAVRDTGIGISAAGLADIFTMFSQIDGGNARSDGGLGIGLALVKGLVGLHGGTVAARSAGLGHGSEFVITLPASVVVGRPASLDAPELAGGPESGRRVLVADDNKDAAETLAHLLTLEGHEVRIAHDGREALALARIFRPEVALLDIGMPDMNGYEVAKSLRREPWGGAMVLAAVTGWGQEEHRRSSVAAGFDTHLTKPVDPAQVVRLITGVSRRVRVPLSGVEQVSRGALTQDAK